MSLSDIQPIRFKESLKNLLSIYGWPRITGDTQLDEFKGNSSSAVRMQSLNWEITRGRQTEWTLEAHAFISVFANCFWHTSHLRHRVTWKFILVEFKLLLKERHWSCHHVSSPPLDILLHSDRSMRHQSWPKFNFS